MNPGSQWVVAVDLGGTNLRGARLSRDLEILDRARQPTERHSGAEAVVDRIAALVRSLCRKAGVEPHDLAGVGVATPGPLDVDRAVVTSAPSFPGWRLIPLRRMLEDRLGTTVLLENDANAAALGEYFRGAGRGARSLVFLGLGTGVGGGIVLDGRVVRGAHGVGGELGHILLDPDGPVCGCGNRGCLEVLASATAVVRTAREALAAGAVSPRMDVPDLDAQGVFEAARAGDPVARAVVDRMAAWLARGIVSLVHTVDPEVVVIGGGVSESADLFLDRVREGVDAAVFPAARGAVRVTRAELGDDAGIVGAARDVIEGGAGPA